MPPLDEAFVHRITQDFPDEAGALLRCLDKTEPSCAIRLNPAKRLKYGFPVDHLPIEAQIPWCSDGYFLTERPFFAWDPLWHAAACYVQDAASQALSVIKPYLPTEPIRALDLCAAPGGKATLLSAYYPRVRSSLPMSRSASAPPFWRRISQNGAILKRLLLP